MLRKLLLLAVCASLTASAFAQNQLSVKKAAPIQYLGTYHMATDSWTGGARVGTNVVYNCQTVGNYYSNVGNSFATNADHLWIDEGELADSNTSEVTNVSGFDFAYCSTDLDPTGNSGSVGVLFYDDHGSCATGETATCNYLLSGLPLSTTGNTACWAVGVDLAGGFECTTSTTTRFRTMTGAGKTDSHFGWAFGSNPGVAGRNNTGPILDLPCANPLSNCSLGGSLQGNENFFAWEDPAGVWTGCYWFGGVPWASFSMKMYSGNTGTDAFAYYGAAGTTNANTLTATDFGGTCTFTSTTSTGGAGVYFVAALTTGSLNVGAFGTLLVSTTFLSPTPLPMPGGTLTVTLPATLPPVVYAQAVETTGPATPAAVRELSNGLQLCDGGGGGGGGGGSTTWKASTNVAYETDLTKDGNIDITVDPLAADADVTIDNGRARTVPSGSTSTFMGVKKGEKLTIKKNPNTNADSKGTWKYQ